MDTLSLLISCDERYNRHLANISCWTYEFGDYSYIREKIWEFVNIQNNNYTLEYKIKLIKYIDSEIMLMNSISLMNNMEINL
jgi:hypothetical protein